MASVKVFLVRHAKAGDRERWTEPDDMRPLTKAGWEQAEALVGLLADESIEDVYSSYYARCAQTVQPLAKARSLAVENDDAFIEGAPVGAALGRIRAVSRPTVFCTHGDILGGVIGHLQGTGTRGADASLGKKASTWVLDVDGGSVVRATYLPPPR